MSTNWPESLGRRVSREGANETPGTLPMDRWVTESKLRRLSTSLPNISIRTGQSSPMTNTSIMPPRREKCPGRRTGSWCSYPSFRSRRVRAWGSIRTPGLRLNVTSRNTWAGSVRSRAAEAVATTITGSSSAKACKAAMRSESATNSGGSSSNSAVSPFGSVRTDSLETPQRSSLACHLSARSTFGTMTSVLRGEDRYAPASSTGRASPQIDSHATVLREAEPGCAIGKSSPRARDQSAARIWCESTRSEGKATGGPVPRPVLRWRPTLQ
ncbi:MAG: hypothetical protein CNCCGFBP_00025 [Fimbriimonadaceae bacterium]|nr:hypothetical protein [Fimbriimonadaceae bacterium]